MRSILFSTQKFKISDICKRINVIYANVDLDRFDIEVFLIVKTRLKVYIRRKCLSYTNAIKQRNKIIMENTSKKKGRNKKNKDRKKRE
jgi:hypothetical protein